MLVQLGKGGARNKTSLILPLWLPLLLDIIVKLCTCVQLCDPMDCSTQGFPVISHLLEFESVMPSSHLILAVVPFCLQSFPASGSFPRSWVFAASAKVLELSGQSIGALASRSVFPMNIQGWFPLGLTGLISLLSQGLSRVFNNHSWKASIFQSSASFMVELYALHYSKNYYKKCIWWCTS